MLFSSRGSPGKLSERGCSLGRHCLADPDGILVDVKDD
jgi:hypothetical protein